MEKIDLSLLMEEVSHTIYDFMGIELNTLEMGRMKEIAIRCLKQNKDAAPLTPLSYNPKHESICQFFLFYWDYWITDRELSRIEADREEYLQQEKSDVLRDFFKRKQDSFNLV
jgi:hypothetical protein